MCFIKKLGTNIVAAFCAILLQGRSVAITGVVNKYIPAIVYSAPDVQSPKLGLILNGTKLNIIDIRDNWALLIYNDNLGWVQFQYCEVKMPRLYASKNLKILIMNRDFCVSHGKLMNAAAIINYFLQLNYLVATQNQFDALVDCAYELTNKVFLEENEFSSLLKNAPFHDLSNIDAKSFSAALLKAHNYYSKYVSSYSSAVSVYNRICEMNMFFYKEYKKI